MLLLSYGGDINSYNRNKKGKISNCLSNNINRMMYGLSHEYDIEYIIYLINNVSLKTIQESDAINMIARRSQLHKNPDRQKIFKLLILKLHNYENTEYIKYAKSKYPEYF